MHITEHEDGRAAVFFHLSVEVYSLQYAKFWIITLQFLGLSGAPICQFLTNEEYRVSLSQ